MLRNPVPRRRDSRSSAGVGLQRDHHAAQQATSHGPVGLAVVAEPIDGPFGRTVTFADPDGYHVTLHDRA